jgi:hypothetical protein
MKWKNVQNYDLIKSLKECLSWIENDAMINALSLFVWWMNLYDYLPSKWMCDYDMLLWTYLW